MPKAYVFTANGGPEVESFADLPRPVEAGHARGKIVIEVAR